MKHTYSLRWAWVRRSLLTLLFQQHRIKGSECVLNLHWVPLTGDDTGASHFSLTCLRQMREGNICTPVTRSVMKRICLLLKKKRSSCRAQHPKALKISLCDEAGNIWDSWAEFGLLCRDKKIVCVTGRRVQVLHTNINMSLIVHSMYTTSTCSIHQIAGF